MHSLGYIPHLHVDVYLWTKDDWKSWWDKIHELVGNKNDDNKKKLEIGVCIDKH